MSKLLLSTVLGGALALSAVSAQAFPAAPASAVKAPSDVIAVAGGCGAGWYRVPSGVCRPKGVVVVPPRRVVVAPPPRVVVGPRCVNRVGPHGRVVRVCR